MNVELKFWTVIFLIVAVPLGLGYWWMTSSCAERGQMEGYAITKTVATKCYGSNDGKDWYKIWY